MIEYVFWQLLTPLMYYLPKFWFSKDVLRKDIAIRRRLRKLKEKG
ncbi:hypothetical protein [Venenivibrio stagnispumantis]|nr:hypothetical protein [Venenivibrio stagnispumantis]MCW4573688.1 hypothetical protein [Venenivibrio stagnispumantis]